MAKNTLAEGDIVTDKLVVQLRATRLCGLASILFLRFLGSPADADRMATCRKFIEERLADTFLWGEGDIPLYIAVFFALRRFSATIGPEMLLFRIIDAICARNRPTRGDDSRPLALVSPYYDGTYAVLRALGMDEEPIKADFSGSSYCLESIVYMVARRLWKQGIRFRWEAISHISFLKFSPRKPWMYYLWRCEEGDNFVGYPDIPADWTELLRKSRVRDDDQVPDYLRHNPLFFMLFLIVVPHRLNPATMALLDGMWQT